MLVDDVGVQEQQMETRASLPDQPLGIVPTYAYWKRVSHLPLFRWASRIVGLALGIPIGVYTYRWGLSYLVVPISVVAALLVMGGTERLLRRVALRRARLRWNASKQDPEALPAGGVLPAGSADLDAGGSAPSGGVEAGVRPKVMPDRSDDPRPR